MDNTKLCHPDWELLVTSIPGVKDETMPRTVHRFQTPLLLLNVEREHAVLVILPVSRSLPEFAVVHIRRDNWCLEAWSIVFCSQDASGRRLPS